MPADKEDLVGPLIPVVGVGDSGGIWNFVQEFCTVLLLAMTAPLKKLFKKNHYELLTIVQFGCAS